MTTANAGLVSIIINNYNYCRFLDDSIRSALDQDNANVEVVVVDDGSSDESPEIIRSYRRAITPVLKENGGQGSAFNAGFESSRGEIIIFLDADDVLLPAAAGQAGSILEPSVSRVYWPMWIIDAHGRRSGGTTNAVLPEGDLSHEVLTGGPYQYRWSPTSGNAWARSFLEAVLPVPEAPFDNYVDNYLSALSPLYGVHRRSEPLGCYRRHGANETAIAPDRERFMERLASWLGRFDVCFDATSKHAERLGLEFDADQWIANSWFHRIAAAVWQLLDHVPDGSSVALLDEETWQVGSEIDGRQVRPFPEREGTYWGRPADDAAVVEELERMRDAGIEWVVIAWTSCWWLEAYPDMAQWLKLNTLRVHSDRNITIYEISNLRP